MPKLFDPQCEFTVWLDSDSSIPIQDRPVCIGRPISVAKFAAVMRTFAEAITAQEEGQFAEATALILDCFMKVCTGWRNMRSEFSRDAAGNVFTINEMMELFTKLRDEAEVSVDEAGKSESPQPFVLADSAAGAVMGASVQPSQASPSLSASTVLNAGTEPARNHVTTAEAVDTSK